MCRARNVSVWFTLMLGSGCWASDALVQNLPPPSRTVFKCDVAGQVVYSDSPCLGAKKIDAEPTRGVNKLSGRERAGDDVRREQHREIMHEGLIKPITGMDAKQYETYERRFKLAPEAKKGCASLDTTIARAELDEREASRERLGAAQQTLFAHRARFRELGC
ncbi:MAG: hypothetical protein ACRD7E_29310 [Bryobacteraceae bacterium]